MFASLIDQYFETNNADMNATTVSLHFSSNEMFEVGEQNLFSMS